jgi:rRNA-processing protein EBP2
VRRDEGVGHGENARAATKRLNTQHSLIPSHPIHPSHPRRKQRDAKQFSKRVQAERKKEKVAARKAAVAGVAKLRADRKRAGFAPGGPDAGAAALDLMDGSVRAALGTRFDPAASRKPSAKRAARDAKYGYGGRANTGRRRNDASSAADMRDYRPARFDDGFGSGKGKGGRGGGGQHSGGGGGGFGKKKGGGAAKRPGKARRAAARAGRG